MAYQISWTAKAKKQFEKILTYIENDSPQNAIVVLKAIDETIVKASNNPYRYSLEKYKINNNGEYRSFEVKKIRVSYKVADDNLVILRCRHTKRRPAPY